MLDLCLHHVEVSLEGFDLGVLLDIHLHQPVELVGQSCDHQLLGVEPGRQLSHLRHVTHHRVADGRRHWSESHVRLSQTFDWDHLTFRHRDFVPEDFDFTGRIVQLVIFAG